MGSKKTCHTDPGNTPLKNVPSDYYPKGCGSWFILHDGEDKGKKLFYQDCTYGTGHPERTIVFVHGNPESSYTYRKIIKAVANSHRTPVRIIAMDHIGFGLSDQASYEMVCMDHARNLLQVIRYLKLNKVTLIIHDWGGPIGIGAFLHEPECVDHLIILNSTIFPIPDQGYTYKNYPIPWLGWCRTPTIIPDRCWGSFAAYAIFRTPAKPMKLLSRMILFLALSEIGILPENEKTARRIYKEQFRSKMNVRSSKRLVKQSAVWGRGNIYSEPAFGERDTTSFYKFIQNSIGKTWGPHGKNIGVWCLSGGWDPLGKESVIRQWLNELPQLSDNIKIFKNDGHFIEENRPKEIANVILNIADQ